MDSSTLLTIAGVCGTLLLGLLGLAYKDPNFYIKYAEPLQEKVASVLLLFSVGLFVGSYLVRNYVVNEMNLTNNALDSFNKEYNRLFELNIFLFLLSTILYIACIFMLSVSYASKRSRDVSNQ